MDYITATEKNSDLLTLKELCNMLSISEATGRNWLKLGKLKATTTCKKRYYFSKDYAAAFLKELSVGTNASLKSRRNKKYLSGSSLYRDYIHKSPINIGAVEKITSIISSMDKFNDNKLKLILAECALQLLTQRYRIQCDRNCSMLELYLEKSLVMDKYSELVEELLPNSSTEALNYIMENKDIFNIEFFYEENLDILGLLYISCKNISNRKAMGTYYTPTKVVRKLISNLFNDTNYDNKKILDPCCGTGNFLLQLPSSFPIENIYGNDIDEISIALTRINIALKYNNCNIDILYNNFTVSDYLHSKTKNFDYIIGNPPWGNDYNNNQKEEYRKLYKCASGNNIESFNLFIENSLNKLNSNGILSFVLPESILNVSAHKPVRALIMKENSIQYINYLGNTFDKVQCPSVILQIIHNGKPFTTAGMKIETKNSTFTVSTKRNTTPDFFSFSISDAEYKILEKLLHTENCKYLENNGVFALGLVTGDNSQYISNIKNNDNEIILKGSNIYRYYIKPSNNYIVFNPKNFQQTAPTEIYRSQEKLLYRFICNQLVFAYDNNQTLSLNSCNILIPQIPQLNIKYIMAVLNSRTAQFIFAKQFQSVKVLRSHIEKIPIPIIQYPRQKELIKSIDALIAGADSETTTNIYNHIDKQIASYYNLTEKEYNTILQSLANNNLFLC